MSESKDWPRLCRHLATPQNADEMILLVTAMVKQKLWQQAKDILKTPIATELLTEPTIGDFEQMIRAEEVISR